MHIYALLFVAESGTLYIYYYGWDKMKEGLMKWLHSQHVCHSERDRDGSHVLANSWIGFHDVSSRSR